MTSTEIIIRTNTFPIPLTEDILKENEFECIDEECCWYRIIGSIFYDHEHGKLDYLFNDFGLPICDVNYAHELQHILRLFGQNKRADNFKLETINQ